MSNAKRDDPRVELLRFLRSAAADPLPEDLTDQVDEAWIAEELHRRRGSGDAWIAGALEHERWVGHALERLDSAALQHAHRTTQPLGSLLDELAEQSADLGLLGGLTHLALTSRDDLDTGDRKLLEAALLEVAAAGARAWARVDQARCLLATNRDGQS